MSMVYGVDSIWSSMGYAVVLLIYFRVGKVPSVDIGAWVVPHCVLWCIWSGVHPLIFFSCSNFLEFLDHCNLSV